MVHWHATDSKLNSTIHRNVNVTVDVDVAESIGGSS
jgi:hypothetical protein